MMNSEPLPATIAELETIYGQASNAGFGSAVFFSSTADTASGSLETDSKAIYQTFCGELWEEFGVENWLAQWKRLLERPAGSGGDIVAEIQSIRDPESGSAAQMLLDAGPSPERAEATLRAAFNNPEISQLQIFKIGDGGAMSGVIIAAETTTNLRYFLIILLD